MQQRLDVGEVWVVCEREVRQAREPAQRTDVGDQVVAEPEVRQARQPAQRVDVADLVVVENLNAGDYDVMIDLPSGFDLNGQANPVAVSVQPAQTATANFVIRLLASGTISGTVADSARMAIRDVTVSLVSASSGQSLRGTATSASGDTASLGSRWVIARSS